MPRPRKCRRITATPDVTYFKPRGVPLRELTEAYLSLDGFEALRLADLEGLSHEAAAQQMQVSRQTFGRILSSARRSVAKALVGGLALRIQGDERHPCYQSQADEIAAATTAALEAARNPSGYKESEKMAKIAITSEGPTLDQPVDPRFGRAAGFIVVDPESMSFDYVENGEAQARAQGAGIQAAETIAGTGATAVLTGFVGPKAFQALAAAGIRIAQNLDNMSVKEAIDRYQKGELVWSEATDAKGYGG